MIEQERAMRFKKKYDNQNDFIIYDFRKEGNLWIGNYEGEFTGIGGAQCEIYDKIPRINWDARCLNERISQELIEENERKFAEFEKKDSATLFVDMCRNMLKKMESSEDD